MQLKPGHNSNGTRETKWKHNLINYFWFTSRLVSISIEAFLSSGRQQKLSMTWWYYEYYEWLRRWSICHVPYRNSSVRLKYIPLRCRLSSWISMNSPNVWLACSVALLPTRRIIWTSQRLGPSSRMSDHIHRCVSAQSLDSTV